MQIISHRGYWKEIQERNSETAFVRSSDLGFGTETDIRDYNGEIVISHDIAQSSSISLDKFLKIYKRFNSSLPLALNIKADGLQEKLKEALRKNDITSYFTFDMSIPDTLGYIDKGLVFFSRQSEYEPIPAFYEKCAGIWLDAFKDIWYNAEVIKKHVESSKQVVIVSPDVNYRRLLRQ